jgi:antitoxin (DNA-binding transcriptional repressor) of toxin-antitoxin stability system
METVNIHEAKTRLSQLIADAVKGKPFVIAKAGKPLVKVERLDEAVPKGKRKLGFMVGQGHVPEDFDEMGREEIERMFYGEDD